MAVIEVSKFNITEFSGDAIVNAANSSLLGGGGVDGAIHRAAGAELAFACRLLGGCKTGSAKITAGFNLKCRFIIHTVGPFWSGGKNNENAMLESCYRQCLMLAEQHSIRSICFPAISTGIYKFPKEPAANIAFKTVNDLLITLNFVDKIIFCCQDSENYSIYKNLMEM